MPYTDEFQALRRRFYNQYSDKAKAETFAYETAFNDGIKTFREERKQLFKINKKGNAFTALLFGFMALLIISFLFPLLRENINNTNALITNSTSNAGLIHLILTYFPVIFVIIFLIILLILMR